MQKWLPPQRIRLSLLFLVIHITRFWAGICNFFNIRAPEFKHQSPRNSGISIIIPERDGTAILHACLSSVTDAVNYLVPVEPVEILVVVNGSPKSDYLKLFKKFPQVRWLFFKKPLGFSSAIRKGLHAAVYDWIYLLNNDMVLDPKALSEVCKWRRPRVFAVASQIFFSNSQKRREETGWTDLRINSDGIEIFDVLPEDMEMVRGHLYAGGGASLFNRKPLEKLISYTDPFHPFYWEDVDWGFRAWTTGYEVLFCPTSICYHRHRTTVSKFYSAGEIDRIFYRNGIQFELKNMLDTDTPRIICRKIGQLDARTQRELGCPLNCLALFAGRVKAGMAPFRDMSFTHIRRKAYPVPFNPMDSKPVIIIVSPYAVYPPSHGGAVRITKLIRELSKYYDIIFLSDEENLYHLTKSNLSRDIKAIHLIGSRIKTRCDQEERIQRIKTHSHPRLAKELIRLIDGYHPNAVIMEYIELAGLIEAIPMNIPRILTLHDVLISAPPDLPTDSDLYEKRLMALFDTLVVCSLEDAELLNHPDVKIVSNGLDISNMELRSSSGNKTILSVGPFRYTPNFEGICIFLREVYPLLISVFPDIQIDILGGSGASEFITGQNCFKQPGITLIDHHTDVRPYIEKCALTINPQYNIRGSSIKILESISAGRVCISTREGARGFLESSLPGLIVVKRIEDFLDPIVELLGNESIRNQLEQPVEEDLRSFTWARSGRILSDVIARTIIAKKKWK